MNKKRFLIVGDLLSGSGLTKFIFNTFSSLNVQKIDISVVGYGNDDHEIDKKCGDLNWRLYRVPPITSKIYKHIKWWKDFFSKNTFDYIYFNYSASWNFFALKYAKKYQRSVIITHSHNSYYSHSFRSSILMLILNLMNNHGKKIFYKLSDYKIATSSEAARWMFGTDHGVKIVRNGIDVRNYKFNSYKREQIRKKINASKNTNVIGFVGVLQNRKNPLFALKVFEKFYLKEKNSKMVIIGQGPLRKELKDFCDNKNLTNNVIFIAHTSKVNDWYSAMDALLFPSLYEGFGLVPLEAQVSKLDVLASDNLPDIVFATNSITKVKDFNVKNWTKLLELKLYKDKNRNIVDSRLEKFDVDNVKNEIFAYIGISTKYFYK